MFALRAETPKDLPQLRKIPLPSLGPQDALIQVHSAGIAPGPFAVIAAGRTTRFPTTIGHQVAGVVSELGPEALRTHPHLSIGSRVRVNPNITCGGKCEACIRGDGSDNMCMEMEVMGFASFARHESEAFREYHDGGIAQYIKVPAGSLDILPSNVNFDVASKVHDLANAACVLRAANLPSSGSTVVICAATGAMGASCVLLAELYGVAKLILIGRNQERCERVSKLTKLESVCIGLDRLGEDWAKSHELNHRLREIAPQGVHSIIDFLPTGTDVYHIIDSLRVMGTFLHMGGNPSPLPMPLMKVMYNGWQIRGCRLHSRIDQEKVLGWLRDGVLSADTLITHRFSLLEAESAINLLKDRKENCWMIVANPELPTG